jgi:hypothetical protein
MLDREQIEKETIEKNRQRTTDCVAAREMYVVELIDRKIENLQQEMKALQDLKGNMSQNFLHSGAGRIAALIGYD